jgi:hypothetical protein
MALRMPGLSESKALVSEYRDSVCASCPRARPIELHPLIPRPRIEALSPPSRCGRAQFGAAL